MAISGKNLSVLPNDGLSIAQVARCLTRGTLDLGQLCSDQSWDSTINNSNGGWVRVNRINKWSKCKPVRYDTLSHYYDQLDITPYNSSKAVKGQYELMHDAHYGFNIWNEGSIFKTSIPELIKKVRFSLGEWPYSPPRGVDPLLSRIEPFRLLDFNLYHGESQAPVTYSYANDNIPIYDSISNIRNYIDIERSQCGSEQNYNGFANTTASVTYNTIAELTVEDVVNSAGSQVEDIDDMYIALVWHDVNDTNFPYTATEPYVGSPNADKCGIRIENLRYSQLRTQQQHTGYFQNLKIKPGNVYECFFLLVPSDLYLKYSSDPGYQDGGSRNSRIIDNDGELTAVTNLPESFFIYKYEQIPYDVYYYIDISTSTFNIIATLSGNTISITSGTPRLNFRDDRQTSGQRYNLSFDVKVNGTSVSITQGETVRDSNCTIPATSSTQSSSTFTPTEVFTFDSVPHDIVLSSAPSVSDDVDLYIMLEPTDNQSSTGGNIVRMLLDPNHQIFKITIQ